MKHFFLFITGLLLLCSQRQPVQAQEGKKQYQVAAIAFYNFENLFDTLNDPYVFDEEFTPSGANNYTQAVYHQKLHNLAIVLQQLGDKLTPDGPALIGCAEIENAGVLEDLIQQPELKERGYRFVHFNSPDNRGIDVAMLYHPKYFKVISARALPVDISQTGRKGGKTRDVLHVTGSLMGDTVHVLVNHWPSRSGGQAASAPLRALAAAVNRRVIDSITAIHPGSRILVMGDLNDDPVDASVAKVLGATGNKNKIKAGGLYNPWVAFYKKGIGTLGYNDSWNLFDQIILSSGWLGTGSGWRYYKAEVFNRDFLISKFGQYKGYPHRSFSGNTWLNGYSDHFPTLVYVVREWK